MSTETTRPSSLPTATPSPSPTLRLPDRQLRLSLLWVFVTLNYLYCDLLGLMDPEALRQFLAGTVDDIAITQGFLLASSVLMELPMAMVAASVFLPHRANRWANIAVGTIMTLVQIGSLFLSPPTIFYVFFSAVEIPSTVFIVGYAWRWHAARRS